MAQHQVAGSLLIGIVRHCRQLRKGGIVAAVGVDAVVVEQPLAVDALPFGKEAFAGIAADDGAGILEDALKASTAASSSLARLRRANTSCWASVGKLEGAEIARPPPRTATVVRSNSLSS